MDKTISEPKLFITLDVWQNHNGFDEFVNKQWASYTMYGTCLDQVIKYDPKVWNKEIFGDINKEKQRLINEISHIR